MKPTWEREGIRLYHGDCRDVLPHLSGVDAVVTDPPYGQKTHAGARRFVATGRAAMKGFGDVAAIEHVTFESIDANELASITQACIQVAARWVVMTCDWRHMVVMEEMIPESFVRAGVWVKPDSAPQFTGDRPGTGWEAVAILHRPGRKKWNGGGSHAVWTELQNRHGVHPTQKPSRLIVAFVNLFSDKGETILDPFMGSGTTGVACIRTGRKFIGIEKEKKYFDIAVKRITDELDRAPLFTAAKEEQTELFPAP